ncbi:MAG: pantoate--beta-alanine ligase [Verrucomicrobia bacterium]|nr:pantoate--beta-alanine ligase [Verrucomicrobiota bacterium]
MRVIRSTAAMQRLARRCQREGRRVGFVPTMGYLHAGHLSLVHRARRAIGPKGLVVVSIYVNPTQFAPTEDLAKYPRDFARDARLCREAGVDIIFAPSDAEMYPGKSDGRYSAYVVEEKLSRGMEGASRPTHFRGVTTVVAKLFHLVLPDVAVFGAKDWQQAAIVRRMVRDLNFPLRLIVAPTVRERDGLALSSRNKLLTPGQRAQATVLSRALARARAAVKRGPLPAARLKADLARFIAREPLARLDYVECFDADTLQPAARAARGTHLALAVFAGKTRLIDNGRL